MTTYVQTLPENVADKFERATNPDRDYPYNAAAFMARKFGGEFSLKISDHAPKRSNVVAFVPKVQAAA